MVKAFGIVTLAYLVALASAWITLELIPPMHPVWAAAVADSVATVIIFAFSFGFRNSSFYDPYWSVAVIPIVLYWAFFTSGGDADTVRQWLVIILSCAWAFRLTHNWARGWEGLDHADWRYDNLKQQTGAWYWLVSFSGIHFFPTVLVFLGCLSMFPAVAVGTNGLNLIDLAAVIVTAGAICLEGISDNQLRTFRLNPENRGKIIKIGLWAYSRHPNYLGEIGFWWGLYLFALAADPSWWWTGVGALAITLLFCLITIPMMENKLIENKPGYAEHVANSSMLLPSFRSR